MSIVYGSICSGIEAATAAWKPMGWRAAFFAEIEPFPSALLAHRYPSVPNLGDITADDFAERAAAFGPMDVLIGGTPCQSFSVAGKRESLADDRGNLTLVFCRIVERLDPWCVLWENVPGVLSTADNAFGCFLAGLVGASAPLIPGGPPTRWPHAGLVRGPRRSVAWGILDAQFFGLAQRRRRVFVASLRADDWRCPAAILFEPQGLPGHPAEGREAEPDVAPSLTPGARRASGARSGELMLFAACVTSREAKGPDSDCTTTLVADTLKAHHGRGREDDTYIPEIASTLTIGSGGRCGHSYQQAGHEKDLIAHTLRADGFDASEDGTGRGTPLVPVAFNWQSGGSKAMLGVSAERVTALGCTQTPAVAYQQHGSSVGEIGTLCRGRGDVQSGVPFTIHGVNSNARADHAYEDDTARCLDGMGGFAPNQGGTIIGVETDRVRVVVQDTRTGRTASDDRWIAEWWMEGNGSCDCNRATLFGEPNLREGYCDGCIRYRVVSVDPMPTGCTVEDFNQGYPAPDATAFNIIGLAQQGRNHAYESDVSGSLQSKGLNPTGNEAGTVIAFQERGRDGGPNLEHQADQAYSLNAPSSGGRHQEMNLAVGMAVRRLLPVETERLQGFPDGWTDIPFRGKPATDSARYKAIGNSMAVTVIQWLGRRAEWLYRLSELDA